MTGSPMKHRQPTYRIRDWGLRYENNRTRAYRTLAWWPCPNDLASDEYTALTDHPDGAAHCGAWTAMLGIASTTKPRGLLIRANGSPHDAQSLARVSRLPQTVFETVIPRLLEIGLIEDIAHKSRRIRNKIPQRAAVQTQDAAVPSQFKCVEQNRTERTEQNGTAAASWNDRIPEDWVQRIYHRHPKPKFMQQVEQWFVETWTREQEAGHDPNLLMEEIDRVHVLWCASEDWLKERGRYAPPLISTHAISGQVYGWLPDQGWKKPPAGDDTQDEAAVLAEFERREQEGYLRSLKSLEAMRKI